MASADAVRHQETRGYVRVISRARALRVYFDFGQVLVTCLRVYLAPRTRPIAFGLFVNGGDGEALARAACPESTFIRVNYPRVKRGWNAAAFTWLLQLLVRLTRGRPVSAVVWGYRDRTNHGVDVGRYFEDHHRAERALVRPAGGHLSAFIVGARSIYFDGRSSTEFERAVQALNPGALPSSDAGRRIIAHVLGGNLTKYAAEDRGSEGISERDLLIVGQCTGDQAITETDSLARTNPELIELVVERLVSGRRFENVHYKPHPKNSTTASDLTYLRERHPEIRIIDGRASIIPILAAMPAVATLTSGVGLEAALRGCEVHAFGVSFYSHWGFTVDHLSSARRTNKLSAADVFLYMLMEQTKYVDRTSGRRITAVEAFGLV